MVKELYQIKYYNSNKSALREKAIEVLSKPRRKLRYLTQRAVLRAVNKGLEFDIRALNYLANGDIPENCKCCDVKLDYRSGRGPKDRDFSPSIDRVNNLLGYIKNNIQVICFKCNAFKSNRSEKDFKMMIEYINANS